MLGPLTGAAYANALVQLVETRTPVHVSPRPPGHVATIASIVEQAVAPAIELAADALV